jgi:hypothetical protein
MTQPDAWRMMRRRAVAVGIHTPIGNHSFRATGITAYLSNGGALEDAQEMAAHESPRTTKLYDRTKERLTPILVPAAGLSGRPNLRPSISKAFSRWGSTPRPKSAPPQGSSRPAFERGPQ